MHITLGIEESLVGQIYRVLLSAREFLLLQPHLHCCLWPGQLSIIGSTPRLTLVAGRDIKMKELGWQLQIFHTDPIIRLVMSASHNDVLVIDTVLAV